MKWTFSVNPHLFLVAAAWLLSTPIAGAVEPNPAHPPYVSSVYSTAWDGDGKGIEFVVWRKTSRGDSTQWPKAIAQNAAAVANGTYPIHTWNTWLRNPVASYVAAGAAYSPGLTDYAQWITARPYLLPVRDDGTDPQLDTGYVTPLAPLEQADWPQGVTNATFADYQVANVGDFYKQTGARGVFASDGWDSFWGGNYDYNPRVLAAFTAATGIAITGTTVAEQSADLLKNHLKEWNDFRCQAFARVWGGLAQAVWDAWQQPGFIGMQGTGDGWTRGSQDLRMIDTQVRAAHGHFFKVVELQGDVLRALKPVGASVLLPLSIATHIPDAWVAAQLTAPNALPLTAADTALSEPMALSGTWTDAAERLDFANKYLRGHWLAAAWVHIAGTDGKLRRAMQAFHREYGDGGKVPPDIEALLAIEPKAPFGAALYYSRSLVETAEKVGANWSPKFSADGTNAVPVGYGVSDLSLDGLGKQSTGLPTAFIVSDLDQIPAADRQKLEAIAPVYDSWTAARVPSPVSFSGDSNGFGFVDQQGRSIFLMFRDSSLGQHMDQVGNFPTATVVSFFGVKDGSYTMTDLFDGTKTYPFTIAQGKGSVSIPMDRWETRAFSSDLPSPNDTWSVPTDPDQLMLHWALDESGTATVAMDSSGAHRMGRFQDMAAAPWVPGKIGNALTFNGKGSMRTEFGHPSNNFTHSLWFNTTTKPNSLYFVPDTRGSVGMGVQMGQDGSLSSLGCKTKGGDYADGQWHHLALVVDASNLVTVYVDGQVGCTSQATGSFSRPGAGFQIGAYDWYGHYTGSLDEIRVYKRALSVDEVRGLVTDPTAVADYPVPGAPRPSGGSGDGGSTSGGSPASSGTSSVAGSNGGGAPAGAGAGARPAPITGGCSCRVGAPRREKEPAIALAVLTWLFLRRRKSGQRLLFRRSGGHSRKEDCQATATGA